MLLTWDSRALAPALSLQPLGLPARSPTSAGRAGGKRWGTQEEKPHRNQACVLVS